MKEDKITIIGIAGGGSIGAGYAVVDKLMTGRNAVSGTPTGIQKASSGFPTYRES